MADSDDLDGDGTRVSLMTLHTAKGLEFPAVFVVGLEDGIFPHLRSLGEPADLEEERRLFYVGITRARRHLNLSHAWSRTIFGRTQQNIPSRFLAEVPTELVKDVGLASTRREPQPLDRPIRRLVRRRSGDWSGDRPATGSLSFPAAPLTPRPPGPGPAAGPRIWDWWPGDEVVHDHWGPGVVLDCQRRGLAGPGHGPLRVGGEEEPAALGHPAPPGLNPIWRPREGVRIIEAS